PMSGSAIVGPKNRMSRELFLDFSLDPVLFGHFSQNALLGRLTHVQLSGSRVPLSLFVATIFASFVEDEIALTIVTIKRGGDGDKI
ncbi:MAG: hypothetical protein QQN41_09585, partial [Nitrosopumilus sp.]